MISRKLIPFALSTIFVVANAGANDATESCWHTLHSGMNNIPIPTSTTVSVCLPNGERLGQFSVTFFDTMSWNYWWDNDAKNKIYFNQRIAGIRTKVRAYTDSFNQIEYEMQLYSVDTLK